MPDNDLPDRLLTVDEVADYLGYSKGTIYNKVSRGEIPLVRLGRTVRFRRSEVDAWVQAQDAERREQMDRTDPKAIADAA